MTQPQTHVEEAIEEVPYWKKDGTTHYNTHTKGASPLGRMLATYYEAPFTHPYFGYFKCIEGFWYYIRGGCKDDGFRSLNGYRAKKRARTGEKDGTYEKNTVPHLKEVMLHANYFKIDQNKEIKDELVKSTLPFDYYFLHGPGKLLIRPGNSEQMIEIFTELREVFKGNKKLAPFKYDYSELRKHDK